MLKQLENDFTFYRITHIANLEGILKEGLWAMSEDRSTEGYVFIGDSSLTNRRSQHKVPVEPGGTLADYVPFYFGPRSPMLYRIQHARPEDPIDRRGADEIVYLCFRARVLTELNLQFCFTDGHAKMNTTQFFPSTAIVKDHVDAYAVHAKDWGTPAVKEKDRDLLRRKQAELLVFKHVPPSAILYIYASDLNAANQIKQIVAYCDSSTGVGVPTSINDFYY